MASGKFEGHDDLAAAEKQNHHIDLDFMQKIKSLPYHAVTAQMAENYSKPGDQLLDVGTGAGSIPALFPPDRIIDVADAYQSCLDTASKRANVRNAYLLDETNFDIEKLPRNNYAVVTMSHVLEHMRDPIGAIHKVLDRVKPGGHLVLAVPNPVRPLVIASAVLRRDYVNRGHVIAWDRSHFTNMLERILELDVVEYPTDFVQIVPEKGGKWLRGFEKWLAKPFPHLSYSNMAVIRKPY